MQTIAVLMTCHNRREKTLACLDALFSSDLLINATLDVYLVDDGSKDGTSEAIEACYPAVNIIAGDGNLFWNGGMRVAFAAAMQRGFDYYLWLNDDTILYAPALPNLLSLAEVEARKHNKPAVIVGSTQSEIGGNATYGGLNKLSAYRPLTHTMVLHSEPTSCDTMNGNCVLIPSAVANIVGNLEPAFVHAMGDIDYGLRVGQAGFPIMVLPGFIGVCAHNSIDNTFMDMRLSLGERWKKIMSLKGLPPSQWYVLTRRHAGLLWPLLFVWPYVKVLFSISR
jgi:GT2 family glycosyltransferase